MSQEQPDVLTLIQNANTLYGKYSLQSILAGLALSSCISVAIFIAFCILRPRHRIIYEPRLKNRPTNQLPRPGNGLLAWIKPLLKTTDLQIYEQVGLDAVVFLRFWRMCRDILIIFTILGCVILIPVDFAGRASQSSLLVCPVVGF